MPRSKSKSQSKSKSKSKACNKGEIYRKGYTRTTKTGSKVKVTGKCIKATSQSGTKRTLEDKKYLKKKAASHARAKSKTKTKSKSCSKGQIKRTAYEKTGYKRKAYTRADGTKVKASHISRSIVPESCTKDKGKSHGQSRQLFHLAKDVLKEYGYENVKTMTEIKRHKALKKALHDGIKPLPLFRRLNALYTVNKNQNPAIAELFRADRNYIKTTNEYKNRDTARPKSKSKSKGKSQSKNKSKSVSRKKTKSKATSKAKKATSKVKKAKSKSKN